jgi:hypothetical protein
MIRFLQSTLTSLLILFPLSGAYAHDTVENYIKEYPNQEQVKMMSRWLTDNDPGTFSFTGLVDPTDDTVITPQATVNYGYNWFSLSEGPAIVHTPQYDRFFSVSIFDMEHNIPDVIVSPTKPILLIRPGQTPPDGDFDVVEMETDQGLVFTRMVVVGNLDEVMGLSSAIAMDGGQGSMNRDVQRFSPEVAASAMRIIEASVPEISPDIMFGKVSGDIGAIAKAAGVLQGQLGTPVDTVRYGLAIKDAAGQLLKGGETYVVTVPAGIVADSGYMSVTAYGVDNKLLIPNDQGIYDRTTYSSKQNDDGTYTITLSPNGEGVNAIPSGKDFYLILRAYVPVPDSDMDLLVEKQ